MTERPIQIRVNGDMISADLCLPQAPRGVVLFAHGSGSSRNGPRNRTIAAELQRSGFGTLLVDLLTQIESDVDLVTRHLRFDIALLTSRLERSVETLRNAEDTGGLSIGLFGAGTGAAAALALASRLPGEVDAIVARAGRPDLVTDILPAVKAPTLFVVGDRDHDVFEVNRSYLHRLPAVSDLAVISGATHLFEEPGALEQVARHAVRWFDTHLEGRSV